MKRARILYAEDDETLSFITKDHLELQGYEIRHCGDGKKTLDEFNLDQFDLVILDVMLPGMDGFSIAEAIRKKNQDKKVAVAKVLKIIILQI